MNGWLWLAGVAVTIPVSTAARLRSGGAAQERQRAPVQFNRIGAAVVAVACLTLVAWPWAPVVAVAAAGASWRLLPRQLSAVAAGRELAVARSLPDLADLLAALLRTGMPDSEALTRVSAARDGPLGPLLSAVARHRRMGAAPHDAWEVFLADPALAQLGQVMVRHAETGSGVAAALDRVAADARRDYFSQAQAAARSAAVRAVVPLAACFLPAFFLLGVAPIVASLFTGLKF